MTDKGCTEGGGLHNQQMEEFKKFESTRNGLECLAKHSF
jgi:hypothetical protein